MLAASSWAAVTIRSASVLASETVASAVRWASSSVRLIVSASPELTGAADVSRAVLDLLQAGDRGAGPGLHGRRLVLCCFERLGDVTQERLHLVRVESPLG